MRLHHQTIAAGLVAMLVLPSAQATSIYLHSGATDPGTEGWTETHLNTTCPSAPFVVGPVINDAGSGLDAWTIDDNCSAGTGNGRYYSRALTVAETAGGDAAGWRLSARVRVVNTADGFASVSGFGLASAVSVFYRDGDSDWYLGIGSQADGDPLIRLPNNVNSTFALEGGGSGYHLYELVFDPLLGSADFFIDGTERVSNIVASGTGAGQRAVTWGATTSPDAGQGNYNLVYLSLGSSAPVVPVPPALLLFGSGVATLGWLRRRPA